jgi:hypothetical protein
LKKTKEQNSLLLLQRTATNIRNTHHDIKRVIKSVRITARKIYTHL